MPVHFSVDRVSTDLLGVSWTTGNKFVLIARQMEEIKGIEAEMCSWGKIGKLVS